MKKKLNSKKKTRGRKKAVGKAKSFQRKRNYESNLFEKRNKSFKAKKAKMKKQFNSGGNFKGHNNLQFRGKQEKHVKANHNRETSKQNIIDVEHMMNNLVEYKIGLKKSDNQFIKHLKILYDANEHWILLRKSLEEIVLKYVIRKKKENLKYDTLTFYWKKMKKQQQKERNTDAIVETQEIKELLEKEKESYKDKHTRIKKLILVEEEDRIFEYNEEKNKIEINIKRWKKKIKTLLKSKINSTSNQDLNENQQMVSSKTEDCILYDNIPKHLIDLLHLETLPMNQDKEHHEGILKKMNIKMILKRKIHVSDWIQLIYHVGMNRIFSCFESFITMHAPDEDRIHLEIINNKNNIFSDRINNIVVLVKKNPLVYIMYVKLLIQFYDTKEDLFLKKCILQCMKHIFLFIIPKEKLQNTEDHNSTILVLLLNLFFNRFNYKDVNCSSFYFFFHALIYLYAWEQFVKKTFSNYIFILKNCVYSSVPSIFFQASTSMYEFCLEKSENRYASLNILMEGYLTIKKGNPLLLNLLKRLITKESMRNYIAFFFFDKILMNMNFCVDTIVQSLKNKEDPVVLQKKLKQDILSINRCLYILYKMKTETFSEIIENIIYFSIYMFELFSMNIYELHKNKELYMRKWKRTQMESLIYGRNNMNKATEEDNKTDTHTSNEMEEVESENTQKNKEEKEPNKIENKEEKESNKIENKEEKEPNKIENKEDTNNSNIDKKKKKKKKDKNVLEKHCLYRYLSKKVFKLLSSILVKNIYFIIYNKCIMLNNGKNSEQKSIGNHNGFTDIRTNESMNSEEHANRKKNENRHQLKGLNYLSFLKVIQSVDSYQIKINFLSILFLLAYSQNQVDDNMYCYFYSIMKNLNYYESEHTRNFYSLLTILILTDNNINRNVL